MSKFTLMIIGTIAIGLFALPGVISTFAGSHEYVAPENVECAKCHPDVLAELQSSESEHTHANPDWTVKQYLDCNECHIVGELGGSPGAGHAARLVDCAICHNKTLFESTGESYAAWGHDLSAEYGMACADCHMNGENGYEGNLSAVYDELNDPNSAHFNFYQNSVNDSTLMGGSESCIGCHAHMEFTFTEPLGTANMTYDPVTGEFGKE